MRYRGIDPRSQASYDDDVSAKYDEALVHVRGLLQADPDMRELVGTVHEHDMAGSYAEWLIMHDTAEDRANFPFHLDCGWGHNPEKVSCEQVDEMISADEEMGLGMR